MIRRGNLTEAEDWIKTGKPLRSKSSHNSRQTRSMLEFATEVGFYSLIELLLKRVKWTEEELGDAIFKASREGRADLISLLLDHNAPWECAELDEVIAIMDEDLIRRFLALGMRFDMHDAFFNALDCKRARPLLRIYKAFRPEYPEMEDQIAKALVSAVKEKRVWWTIMLRWAGADPNREVPDGITGSVEEDTYTTTAIQEAYSQGDLEFIETIKIDSKGVDRSRLLEGLSFRHEPEILERIVKKMTPDQLNYSDSQSCPNLEYFVRSEFYDFGWYRNKDKEQEQSLTCMRMLLDAGARWNPSDDSFRSTRKGLCSYGAKYIVQVIRLLMYTSGAAPFEKIWKLCNTARMKHLIYGCDDHLWREMNEMALERGLKGATKRSSRIHVSQ